MKYVDEYFDLIEQSQPVAKRRIYLATDDPGVVDEIRRKYVSCTALIHIVNFLLIGTIVVISIYIL